MKGQKSTQFFSCASFHVYKSSCLSVGPLVGWSICLLVYHAFVKIMHADYGCFYSVTSLASPHSLSFCCLFIHLFIHSFSHSLIVIQQGVHIGHDYLVFNCATASVLDSVSSNGKHKKGKKINLTTNIFFHSISAVCDIHRLQFKQREPTKIHSNTSYGERVNPSYLCSAVPMARCIFTLILIIFPICLILGEMVQTRS